jgi:hypothetical protein
MVNLDPEKKLTNIPPIIAVNKPISGGNSDALAIPKLSGRARRNTMKPEIASLEKFSRKPAQPSLGIEESDLFMYKVIVCKKNGRPHFFGRPLEGLLIPDKGKVFHFDNYHWAQNLTLF